jgi:7-cyano-7-deazaguanine synthase
MKVVPLVSGGLDSAVMSVLMYEEGWELHPLFINYGQINLDREREACFSVFKRLGLPNPKEIELPGYGAGFPSGLTTPAKSLTSQAFLPGRNMLFLLCAAAHAFEQSAEAVAIGFLDEKLSLFPDQTRKFAKSAEQVLSLAMGKSLSVITPLISLEKGEVLEIAKAKGVVGTYSCHAGTWPPCGQCIACREYDGLEVDDGR